MAVVVSLHVKDTQERLGFIIMEKFILDACCGGRCFWFDKKHPNTLYIDNRVAPKGHCPHRKGHSVEPDIVMDNTAMSFKDKSFKLVVFDPPHMTCGERGWQWAKYGAINKETWAQDLKKSFNECWRVLEDYGVLIFKWNETSVKRKDVLKAIGREPLFGHPTNSKATTHWFCFMKIPK